MRIVTAARPHSNSKRWVFYPYRNEHGLVIFRKARIPLPGGEKTFCYQWQPQAFKRPDPRYAIWFSGKPEYADDYLYHLPDLLAAKAAGDDIWWCEGEKDADRLEEEDVVTTSHHGGAGHITVRQAEWFRGHTGRVILLYDRDEDGPTGANPGAYDVVRRYDLLQSVGIERDQIEVLGPAEGKDVYDHLAAGHSLDDLVQVTDFRPFRDKAKRGNGFSAWGYGEADPEIEEAMVQVEREGWKVNRDCAV